MELQPITPDSLDDEALTDLIEIRKSGVEHHANEGNKVQHAIQSLTLIALVELQQRRDADSSDPIYQLINDDWYDTTKEIYESVVSAGGTGRVVYTAPQPAPVMNDELYKLANHVASSKNGLPEEWQDWAEELESEIRRAAMLQGSQPVSNRDALPLDYLQGHKDGLEWAAQLAEANHPQTGDWLYDDPIELAKAIRKGPDMPKGDGNSPVIGVDLASGPDRTVEVRYVAPPGYVMVPIEPTMAMLDEFDSIIDHGAEDSKDAWSRLIAAAAPQQEVK